MNIMTDIMNRDNSLLCKLLELFWFIEGLVI